MQRIWKGEKEYKIAIQINKGYKGYAACSGEMQLSGNTHYTDSTNEMKQSLFGIIEIISDTVFELDKTYNSQETISEEKTE